MNPVGSEKSTQRARGVPPVLEPDAVSVLAGATFAISDPSGDIGEGTVSGFFHEDTRLLSRCRLTIDGCRPLRLSVSQPECSSASFFLTNPELDQIPGSRIAIVRRRTIEGSRLVDEVSMRSYLSSPVRLELRMSLGADFADVFEVKDGVEAADPVGTEADARRRRIRFRCRMEGFRAATVVLFSQGPRFEGSEAVFEVDLAPRRSWDLSMLVRPEEEDSEFEPSRPVVVLPAQRHGSERWQEAFPELETGDDALMHAYQQSARDIAALRLHLRVRGHEVTLPAAGMPWFMTIFGRDTLITAFELLPFAPDLASGALQALGALQGDRVDDFRDEQPGKILHEIRFGKLTALGRIPHERYYGSVDATPLWLILLSEHRRLSGDDGLCRRLRGQAMAALGWIDRFGDLDGDGFVEYDTRSPHGLENQGWKDSWDGVQFADGTLPERPVALCEVQGYVYDAKIRLSEIAEEVWGDPGLAAQLRREASGLLDRFNETFWIDGRGGYYALGLDADKRLIDGMTSNMGHLLWSGIVPEDRAGRVAERLLSEDLYSGWGVRTVSSEDVGYNPIAYHMGSVWPHDNALLSMGLMRYGLRDEAARIAGGLWEAAGYTNGRLAEVFGGFPRAETGSPVRCPTASSPQAWAAGASLLLLRSMLGLDVVDGRVTCAPALPEELGSVEVRGLRMLGGRVDVRAEGSRARVHRSA